MPRCISRLTSKQRRGDPHADRERLVEQPGEQLRHVAERRRAAGRHSGVARRERLQQQVMAVGDEQQHQRGGGEEVARQRALGRLVGIEDRRRRKARLERQRGARDVQRGEGEARREPEEQPEQGLAAEQPAELERRRGQRRHAGSQRPRQHGAHDERQQQPDPCPDVGLGEAGQHHEGAAGAHEDQQDGEQVLGDQPGKHRGSGARRVSRDRRSAGRAPRRSRPGWRS